jgi:hypothetical protein
MVADGMTVPRFSKPSRTWNVRIFGRPFNTPPRPFESVDSRW